VMFFQTVAYQWMMLALATGPQTPPWLSSDE